MMKRFLDIGLIVIGLLPVLGCGLVLYLLIRIKLGTPVFFRQARPGLDGDVFELIKFRTMTDARNEDGELLPDADRLTRFGQWLRSSSLDELPEIWNVLKGEMSFVGPRPLLVEYLPLYSEKQMRRHEVRPGITGWAQINGRNTTSWEERFEMDVWYVENRSMALDLIILWKTCLTVLGRQGVHADGHVTMPRFKGEN